MTVDIINNWPLMVMPLPGDKAIQKEVSPHFIPQNRQKPIIVDTITDSTSDILWKKGALIDVYA